MMIDRVGSLFDQVSCGCDAKLQDARRRPGVVNQTMKEQLMPAIL
jgi:hypothetical protein